MSARNVNLCPSQGIEKILAMPKSTFFTPSRKNVLRPTARRLKSVMVSARKAERRQRMRDVNGWLTLLPVSDGSRRTGRLSLKPSKFRSSAVVVTVNGVPFASFDDR